MKPNNLTKRLIDGIEVTEGSDNVFADLGLPDADLLLAKAELARQIGEAIRERKWTQRRAADMLGVSQPRVSDLLRGHLDKFSLDTLMEFLTKLRRNVTVFVSGSRNDLGHIQVLAKHVAGATDRPLSACEATYDRESRMIHVLLRNRCTFGFPPAAAPQLRGVSETRLAQVKVDEDGSRLYWTNPRVEVPIPEIVAAALCGGDWGNGGGRRDASISPA
jgi:predicted XRE-type DNA-binding protein